MPLGAVMLARLKAPPSEEALRDWRIRMVADLSLDLEEHFYREGPLLVVTNQEHGPVPTAAEPREGDVWVDANLLRAYYGPGEEKGYLPLFVACAEWFEAHLPDCEVWYGNDCTDTSLIRFDERTRLKFIAYFAKVGSEPYYEKDKARAAELRKFWPD